MMHLRGGRAGEQFIHPSLTAVGNAACRDGWLIIRYTDGTVTEEFFREAPHDYAVHLSMLTTVDSARIEVSLPGQPA